MAEIKLYTIIISIMLFAGMVYAGIMFMTPILTANDVTWSDDEQALNASITKLRDDTDQFYIDLGAKKINSSATDDSGNTYNLGAVGSVLKFVENLGDLMTSTTDVLKEGLKDLPGWFWWMIVSLLGFTVIWKIVEAWLGHDA